MLRSKRKTLKSFEAIHSITTDFNENCFNNEIK